MTLGEKLFERMAAMNMRKTSFIRHIGISFNTFESIVEQNIYTQSIALKIANNLGSDFDEFVTVSTCEYCGKTFYNRIVDQKCCCRVCSNALLNQTLRLQRTNKIKSIDVDDDCYDVLSSMSSEQSKPAIDLNQYAALAKAQSMSYGELKALERLNCVRVTSEGIMYT